MQSLLHGSDIDRRLGWHIGRSERLARRGDLPHVVLPDGSLRFEWESIEPLIQRFPSTRPSEGVAP